MHGLQQPAGAALLAERRIEAVIPAQANEEPRVCFDRDADCERTVVDRTNTRFNLYSDV
jgi:hypothetical protein